MDPLVVTVAVVVFATLAGLAGAVGTVEHAKKRQPSKARSLAFRILAGPAITVLLWVLLIAQEATIKYLSPAGLGLGLAGALAVGLMVFLAGIGNYWVDWIRLGK